MKILQSAVAGGKDVAAVHVSEPEVLSENLAGAVNEVAHDLLGVLPTTGVRDVVEQGLALATERLHIRAHERRGREDLRPTVVIVECGDGTEADVESHSAGRGHPTHTRKADIEGERAVIISPGRQVEQGLIWQPLRTKLLRRRGHRSSPRGLGPLFDDLINQGREVIRVGSRRPSRGKQLIEARVGGVGRTTCDEGIVSRRRDVGVAAVDGCAVDGECAVIKQCDVGLVLQAIGSGRADAFDCVVLGNWDEETLSDEGVDAAVALAVDFDVVLVGG